jgi:thiol-disulfide isomerase/thioredoxin
MNYSFLKLGMYWIIISAAGLFRGIDKNEKTNIDTLSRAVISFTLHKGERCLFNYTNIFFEPKVIFFSNPGNKDTIISRSFFTEFPTVFDYGIISETNSKAYKIILQSGDSVDLCFNNRAYLNTEKCKKNTIADGSSIFYNEYLITKIVAKKEVSTWEDFLNTQNNYFDNENKKISLLLSENAIDSFQYKTLLLSCQLHYYKRLFDVVGEKNKDWLRNSTTYLLNEIPKIENILNSGAFLSKEIIDVIYGAARVKSIIKKEDANNFLNLYNIALSLNLGRFKPSFLAYCLRNNPAKNGAEYNKCLNYFKSKYPNSIFSNYIDSVRESVVEGKKILIKDSLISLQGQVLGWNDWAKEKNTIKVIDFWASWCVPCRNLFPYIDSVKKVFKNSLVEFVSVNIDEDITDWKISSEALHQYISTNNYHLLNPRKSDIIKKMQINSIPRIIVLNNEKIISSDFYLPNDKSFIKELKKISAYK